MPPWFYFRSSGRTSAGPTSGPRAAAGRGAARPLGDRLEEVERREAAGLAAPRVVRREERRERRVGVEVRGPRDVRRAVGPPVHEEGEREALDLRVEEIPGVGFQEEDSTSPGWYTITVRSIRRGPLDRRRVDREDVALGGRQALAVMGPPGDDVRDPREEPRAHGLRGDEEAPDDGPGRRDRNALGALVRGDRRVREGPQARAERVGLLGRRAVRSESEDAERPERRASSAQHNGKRGLYNSSMRSRRSRLSFSWRPRAAPAPAEEAPAPFRWEGLVRRNPGHRRVPEPLESRRPRAEGRPRALDGPHEPRKEPRPAGAAADGPYARVPGQAARALHGVAPRDEGRDVRVPRGRLRAPGPSGARSTPCAGRTRTSRRAKSAERGGPLLRS